KKKVWKHKRESNRTLSLLPPLFCHLLQMETKCNSPPTNYNTTFGVFWQEKIKNYFFLLKWGMNKGDIWILPNIN
ncbi:MAG: hypothetical protein II687_09035, partial [Selenomonadaceae bacterium]|nr:hypothetical protein [Selenomonadaceae bacterium]